MQTEPKYVGDGGNGQVYEHHDGSFRSRDGSIPYVHCETCDRFTSYIGTRRCNGCWEVEGRLRAYARSENGRALMRTVLAEAETNANR